MGKKNFNIPAQPMPDSMVGGSGKTHLSEMSHSNPKPAVYGKGRTENVTHNPAGSQPVWKVKPNVIKAGGEDGKITS